MPKKKFTITVEADLAHAEFPTWYNFHGNDEVASNETSAADFSYYVQQVIISELIADGISRQDLEEFLQVVRPEKPEKEVFDGHLDGVSIPPSHGIIDTCASEPDDPYAEALEVEQERAAHGDIDICFPYPKIADSDDSQ